MGRPRRARRDRGGPDRLGRRRRLPRPRLARPARRAPARLGGLPAVGVACLALVVVTAAAARRRGVPVGSGPSLVRRALRAVGRAWAAVHHSHRGLGRPRVLAWVAPAAMGQWVCAWLAIAAVLRPLGLGHVGLTGAGVVLAGVTLAHALPVTPGGVGIIQAGPPCPSPRPTAWRPRTRSPSPSPWPSPRPGPGCCSGPCAQRGRGRVPIGRDVIGQLAHRRRRPRKPALKRRGPARAGPRVLRLRSRA